MAARLEASKAQVKVAESGLAMRKIDYDDLQVRAPFGGVVISKDAQPGEIVSPMSAGGGFTRTGIATIVDMDSREVEVDVNEAYINRVKANQRVEATLDAYPDQTLAAHVINIVPTADRTKATVRVRIGFDQLERADPAGHGHQGALSRRCAGRGQCADRAAHPRALGGRAAHRR